MPSPTLLRSETATPEAPQSGLRFTFKDVLYKQSEGMVFGGTYAGQDAAIKVYDAYPAICLREANVYQVGLVSNTQGRQAMSHSG